MKEMSFLRLFLFFLFVTSIALAAPIRITEVSTLDFGNSAPGDLAKTVPPGTSENASNGSFSVTGNANQSFSIVLPGSPVTLTYKNGPTQDTMTISSFTSFPSGTGVLAANGSRELYIGATRASLKLSQLAGIYSGKYSITVVY